MLLGQFKELRQELLVGFMGKEYKDVININEVIFKDGLKDLYNCLLK